jgi:hypothetical protein
MLEGRAWRAGTAHEGGLSDEQAAARSRVVVRFFLLDAFFVDIREIRLISLWSSQLDI